MEKCLSPGLEQGNYKMNLKHLVVPKSKNVLKKGRACQKDTEANPEELLMAKARDLSNKT